jgi:hypothetical protein
MSQKYLENYKSATAINAEFQVGTYRETIAIEKRKSSKLGCVLYTEISGIKYRIYSGLYRGCLKSLIQKLPPNSRILIEHTIPAEDEKGILWINIRENILSRTEAIETPRELVFLTSTISGNDFQTNVYDLEDTLDALKELRDIFNTNGVKIIKVCPYCVFNNYYSNTSLCLRDLETSEIRETHERIQSRKDFFEYYEKIAWDIEEFHFCSAFLTNE